MSSFEIDRNSYSYSVEVDVACVLLSFGKIDRLDEERDSFYPVERHFEIVLELDSVAVDVVQERLQRVVAGRLASFLAKLR